MRLCQLLLLDMFRVVSEAWTRFEREAEAISAALDLPMLDASDPEKGLADLKSTSRLYGSLLYALASAKLSTEHLLQWLLFDGGGPHCPTTAGNRWLKRANLALQADLEHTRAMLENTRDLALQRGADSSEAANKFESKNLGRLTVIAAIFLPLSFGADLLGMQFRLGELGLILYDYLGLVVSVGLVVFLIHKVVPFVRLVAQFVVANIMQPRWGQAKRNSPYLLARGFLQTSWLFVLTSVWAILFASFIVGITGDIPRSLVVLKHGGVAGGALVGAYLVGAVVFGWLFSFIFELLDMNYMG